MGSASEVHWNRALLADKGGDGAPYENGSAVLCTHGAKALLTGDMGERQVSGESFYSATESVEEGPACSTRRGVSERRQSENAGKPALRLFLRLQPSGLKNGGSFPTAQPAQSGGGCTSKLLLHFRSPQKIPVLTTNDLIRSTTSQAVLQTGTASPRGAHHLHGAQQLGSGGDGAANRSDGAGAGAARVAEG